LENRRDAGGWQKLKRQNLAQEAIDVVVASGLPCWMLTKSSATAEGSCKALC